MHGQIGGPQVLSDKVSHRTLGDLHLVVGVYGGVPLRARQVGISGKLWFMGNGGLKSDKKSVILAITLVFTLQDRTLGDLNLVWLEARWKDYRGNRAAISGKLWLSGKMKSNIGCMCGRVVPRFCL